MKFRLWSGGTKSLPALRTRLRQSPHVLATAQGNELALLDMKRERYYTLNEVGSRAWTLLALGTTRSAIVETICREYDVTSAGGEYAVDEDISRLLSQLYEAGLVVEDIEARRAEPADAHLHHPHSSAVPEIVG
jgi:hypothetical protein